ncbi:MerR family transcriptional regulator [Alicyclobacillus cycloheptanicus]|uniref:DNA-binding transcriptional MerR regulator n=1 Tax=Alicyclobacillus cycloheptanicus TaxID=1457 RepID=A0ABT9XHE4_9BACL|nr:MerR family transcriptional regulator [Alicyclobacillus cycloheptanicus]MDQ0189213.1 DNA-binding transcriptional MerR regulator [Alicyclobacillus cycloheptanicus]WDM00398.1 MerR family transcriptional regulator [Alicyclobacillus cycloheptanicus]
MGRDMHTVEDVVRLLGVTPRTLHYYEEVGLVKPASRTAGGHRLYDDASVQKLQQILRLKNNLGYTLQEIKTILDQEALLDELRLNFQATPSDEEKLRLVEESVRLLEDVIDHIDDKLSKLAAMREPFAERLERCKAFLAQHVETDTPN